MGETGLEPAPILPDNDLNVARIPIPPRPHGKIFETPISFGCVTNLARLIKLRNEGRLEIAGAIG